MTQNKLIFCIKNYGKPTRPVMLRAIITASLIVCALTVTICYFKWWPLLLLLLPEYKEGYEHFRAYVNQQKEG